MPRRRIDQGSIATETGGTAFASEGTRVSSKRNRPLGEGATYNDYTTAADTNTYQTQGQIQAF